MTYVPYRTTITSGDINREPINSGLPIGERVNWMKRFYSSDTGYTQQNYKTSNTVTAQTNSLMKLNNERNKITPPVLDFSSQPRAKLKG